MSVTNIAEKQDASSSDQEKTAPKLPYNLEVEQALLGALLVDNNQIERVSDQIKAEHFYAPAHGRIFEAILKVSERGQTASAATLKSYFEQDADLEKVGGDQYLFDLADAVITTVNAKDYAATLKDLHLNYLQH